MNAIDKSKILVLGTGFLASTFERNGYTILGKDKFQYPDNTIGLVSALKHKKFNTVVNCIGISDTRWCELPENWTTIRRVNGDLPQSLSIACQRLGVKLVHISSGCVYDKKDGAVTELDFTASHCRYVVSKLIGEFGCNLDRDLILRPRLLFDGVRVEGKRNNLIQKFEEFDCFLNEFNTVTSNRVIVSATEALLMNDCSGIYNVGCAGTYTIKQMANALGFNGTSIQDYALRDKAGVYLVNNVMDMSKLINDTGYTPPDAILELKKMFKKMNK